MLNNDLNTIVQKFSEHYHDAWASRKQENGWIYGEQWSDSQKSHPRLKPYSMLNDYVSFKLIFLFCISFYNYTIVTDIIYSLGTGEVPVSYTHLDVYKRQQ